MPVQIQLRKGTAAQWTSANPTLAAGEMGVETDTNKVKAGNGSTAWNSLPYVGGSGSGGLSWQSVQTTGFTAVAGRAYPCNTTSAAFTVTLPASQSAGDQITLTDYAGTWGTNKLTVNPNGSKVNGITSNLVLSFSRDSIQLVYVDSTQGWLIYSGWNGFQFPVEYLVLAGGGGGAGALANNYGSSGGGAGGYREGTAFSFDLGVAYNLTVGGGGTGGNASPTNGTKGSDSVFGLITSTGGGFGTKDENGGSGGSGGGGRSIGAFGSGNTPSTAPSQGNNGGTGTNTGPNYGQGGGGGAGGVGSNGTSTAGGNGGNGIVSTISGTSLTYAGGGGGSSLGGTTGTGGGGVGGNGPGNAAGGAGMTNRGGGGGAGGSSGSNAGGNGGSGVVIIKIPDSRTATFSAGVTQTVSTAVSGFKIYTVTATSTTSETVTFS